MNRFAVVFGAVSICLAACDADYAQEEDEADAEDNATVRSGPLSAGALSPYGADPASMALVPGQADYSPLDPTLSAELVVLGQRQLASAGRVIAPLSDWEGGPIIASDGRDAEAVALAVAPPAPVVDHAAETGSWMMTGGRVVLAEGPEVDASWAARAPSEDERLPVAGDLFVARLPLRLDALPRALSGAIGADVRVFDATREVCIARITGLELEARLVHEPLGPWTPMYSEQELLARGLRAVVATLEPLAGDERSCEAGVVAVGVRAVSPSLFQEASVAPSVRRKATMAMCGLRTWRAQRGLAEDVAPWSGDCRRLAERASVRAFETRGGERFVLVEADGVQAGFRAVREQLDNAWAYVEDTRAIGVMDVQSDGTPELILAATSRAPEALVGMRFAGDLSEPTFEPDWTPVPPRRVSVGGYAVPDYSVYRPR